MQPTPKLQPPQPPAPRTHPERSQQPDASTDKGPAPPPYRPLSERLESWFPFFEAEYGSYLDPDHYSLPLPGAPPPGIDLPVPGTDVCIDGDQLRTKQPITLIEWITDYSKCIVIEFSDTDEEYCPSSAETEVVVFKGHLVSPLIYSEEVCIEYYEEEPIFDEDGVGKTLCTKWETRTRRHPLQYTVRHIKSMGEVGDEEVYVEENRVILFVPHCD